MAKRRARRRSAKRNGSLAVARLSAVDLENIAQSELRNYFDPNGALPPQRREHGGRILFELERLIRRAHRDAARTAVFYARARYEDQQRALGDWQISREAMDRLRIRLTDFELRHPIPPRPRRSVGLARDGWRLWEGERTPARETLAKRTSGASRRNVHHEILMRHRRVKREIRDLVARLRPHARPRGRVFRLVYHPEQHRLALAYTDQNPAT